MTKPRRVSRFSINRLPAHAIKTLRYRALAVLFALGGIGLFCVAVQTRTDEASFIALGMAAIALTCAAGLACEEE